MTSLTLLRGCPRCQWLLSWMNNVHFSGSLPLLGGPLHRPKGVHYKTWGSDVRWYSCWGSVVREMFWCENKHVKRMCTMNPHAAEWPPRRLCCVVCFIFFCYCVKAGQLQRGMRDKRGHSFISHAHPHHTHTSLTGLSSLLSQASLVLSVSLKREKARERDGGRMSGMGWEGRGWVKGGEGKVDNKWLETPVPTEIICQAAPLDSIGSICGGSNRLQELFLPPCTFHLLPPSIFLIVSFSSHPLLASLQPPPPFLCVPLFLCPSLSLPGACLSGSVPVCLFADDSTWSRCDAQQLLLCSPASPPSISLPLTLSLYLSATPPYLSLSPPSISLCLPSNVSYVLIYMSFCSPRRRCSAVNWRVSFYVWFSDLFFCLLWPASPIRFTFAASLMQLLMFKAY